MALSPQQRRDVVSLIMALTPPSTEIEQNLETLSNALDVVTTRVNTLSTSFRDLSNAISDLTTELRDIIVQVGTNTSDLLSVSSKLLRVDASVAKLSSDVASTSESLQRLTSTTDLISSRVTDAETTLTNVTADVSRQSLQLVSLDKRVTSLEDRPVSTLIFDEPLVRTGDRVSLAVDPYFGSVDSHLSSYSAASQLMIVTWLVDVESGDRKSTLSFNVNAHAHGRRTDIIASSTGQATVTTAQVFLVFALDKLVDSSADLPRLIPSHAFAQASVPVDVSYRKGDVMTTWQVYGTYTDNRTFRVPVTIGQPSTVNISYITARFGIDT
uniref:Sigma C n=1 Tax=Avian orthoreovirus TaxID=38170 RepID=A0A4Y5QCT6_9REOV|nr:sigma C [Avian orthoreovirus]